jgi:hypothetical protein
MEVAETGPPDQMAAIRSKSVSKQAQHPFPKFRTIPRGVRLFPGQPGPAARASSAEEKNGLFVSTKSARAVWG